MITRPLELSRERLSEHVWRVTMDDGSVQEEINVRGMVLTPKVSREVGSRPSELGSGNRNVINERRIGRLTRSKR